MKKFLLALALALGFVLASVTFSQAETISLTLVWQDNSNNETGFIVERADVATGPFVVVGTTATDISTYVDASLVAGTQYCYQVKAFNAVGNSKPSNVACAITPAVPATPGNVTVTVTLTP